MWAGAAGQKKRIVSSLYDGMTAEEKRELERGGRTIVEEMGGNQQEQEADFACVKISSMGNLPLRHLTELFD